MKWLVCSVLFSVFLIGCAVKEKETFRLNRKGFAHHFSIDSTGNYQTLTIFSPKSGEVEKKYALIKRGTTVDLPKDVQKIEVPVKNMAALSTTFLGMLKELNALDVVAITTDAQYVWNPQIKARINSGKVAAVSFDQQLAPEDLLKRNVSLVMFSGFGQDFPNTDKLSQLGVVTMPNYDWEEKHPLGKAEWIKVFGALVGKEQEAANYFDHLCANYERAKSNKPKAISQKVLAGCLTGDVWYAPAGESFLAGIMKDAGMDYIYAQEKGTASLSLTLERVSKDERKCAVWINAEAKNLADLNGINAKLSSFEVVKKGRAYSYMHQTSFFWEMNAIHPDWLLEDLIKIGHDQPGQLHFYKRLAQ